MLYIVATPIGNLEDITLRALRVLKEVDVIVCEDTRETSKLLNHYDITNKLFSWHANSSEQELEKILDWLSEGLSIALVTDAGTPTISDPGVLLVQKVYELAVGIKVVPIPGPSALVAALSASGVSSAQFLWLGFLPHKKGRQTLFREIAETNRPVVFYESPHRLEKTLVSLREHVPDRQIIIARELTKIYEEYQRGTAGDLLQKIQSGQLVVKGELVVIVN